MKLKLQIDMLLSIIAIILVASLAPAAEGQPQLVAFTSVPPIAYCIERIGEGRVQVYSMISPSDDPHTFEPKPKQMASLSKAGIYFSTDFPFERVILPKIKSSNPNLAVVDVGYGLPGYGNEQDPHIWTSPLAMLKIADNVYRGIISADPKGAEAYRKNFQDFLGDIVALDIKIWDTLKDVRGKKFVVFHPSWGRFAKDYGLTQVPIEVEGKEPKGADLARLIEAAKAEGVKAIFVSPQHSKKGAKAVADAIGARLIEIDPLSKDWANNLLSVANTFARVL
ncbi:MAG TPA: zinc ABC transporter substrate-binding protein [Acetomicrobium flavidum]|uniref:metal ABC transporter solute-binding protein, Zn/Mn family n=1 Tax=Acetomicrobium flavidum TaxID=49896 RepID=UPI002C50EFFD|nr:zinc ABC transporter substrate-binding protein [Acetomicrobium flavidum]HOM31451.1 zinc ABC transporter substrate-binding protein [Acetomicrobium flavidum]